MQTIIIIVALYKRFILSRPAKKFHLNDMFDIDQAKQNSYWIEAANNAKKSWGKGGNPPLSTLKNDVQQVTEA
jgi:hypothetical protein